MKIKSVVDVITNSSTEVFTLRTKLGLEEIEKLLEELLPPGSYNAPEVLSPDRGILQELIDFDYVFDPTNKVSLDRHRLEAFEYENMYVRKEDGTYDFVEIKGAKELRSAWGKFVMENRDRINESYRTKNKLSQEVDLVPDNPLAAVTCIRKWDLEYLPDGLLDEFFSGYTGPRPETLEIPEGQTIAYWIGKKGFSWSEDNSIPGELFEVINAILDGENWHMG